MVLWYVSMATLERWHMNNRGSKTLPEPHWICLKLLDNSKEPGIWGSTIQERGAARIWSSSSGPYPFCFACC
jgi:hypothetical protein